MPAKCFMAAVFGQASAWPGRLFPWYSHPVHSCHPSVRATVAASNEKGPHHALFKPENSNLLRSTAETVFGSCEGSHEALLEVSAGICGKVALAHASQHLHSAHEIAKRISSDAPVADAGLHWATVWAVDAARSLVRALIDTEDAQQLPTETHGPARSIV